MRSLSPQTPNSEKSLPVLPVNIVQIGGCQFPLGYQFSRGLKPCAFVSSTFRLARRVGIVDRESLARYKKSRRRDHQSNNESVLATITPEWWRGAAALLSKMWPDDEIWYFESDPFSWKYLAGRAGYAIVRNGEPVCYTVTKMN